MRFEQNGKILLPQGQTHYLKNVLRKEAGDTLRLFNGKDGEWIAHIHGLQKKGGEAILSERVQPQLHCSRRVHLYFSPIKKQRMGFLIEKSVELGVTDFHPVLMKRTESRKINNDRVIAQIIEASEQCERMDIPVLHDVMTFHDVTHVNQYPLYAAVERCADSQPIASYDYSKECAFLIGPEGGFDPDESAILKAHDNIHCISLGANILRAETACLACLTYAALSTEHAFA